MWLSGPGRRGGQGDGWAGGGGGEGGSSCSKIVNKRAIQGENMKTC